jgi:ABC-2 type transport system ATP-binding protein
MIEAKNITKRFYNNVAVNSLSFNIKKQEIFGIVGPDGAGKSTLLRILAGILPPDEGKVFIDSIDIYNNLSKNFKEKISYMPQSFGLYEDLTVEENLHFIGKLFSIPKKEREMRIERLYQFSNLKPFKNRLAGRLSGGMKQKLGLMCALMHNPDILILDEPTNGVDPVSRREFWDILYELLKEGTTIVISTAYLDEAERCSRIALMYQGKFLLSGQISEIQRQTEEKLVDISVSNPLKFEKIIREKFNIEVFVRGNSILFFSPDEEIQSSILALVEKELTKEEREFFHWSIKQPTLEDLFIKWIKDLKAS